MPAPDCCFKSFVEAQEILTQVRRTYSRAYLVESKVHRLAHTR